MDQARLGPRTALIEAMVSVVTAVWRWGMETQAPMATLQERAFGSESMTWMMSVEDFEP